MFLGIGSYCLEMEMGWGGVLNEATVAGNVSESEERLHQAVCCRAGHKAGALAMEEKKESENLNLSYLFC